MKRFFLCVAVAALTAPLGCSSNESGETADATVAPPVDACAPGGTGTILFFNRNGGDYTQGSDDPANNVSMVISQSGTAAPWPHGDATWNQMITCVTQKLSRYGIAITETEPTSGEYNELVFTGSAPSVFGLPDEITSNNPFKCGLIKSGIVMLFSGVVQDDPVAHCDQATFSIAKLVGLDNIMNCDDPSTFLAGCSDREYQDVASDCGEFEARACSCGGSQENHHQMMLSRLGPSCR